MTNTAFIKITSTDTEINLFSNYDYGMMSDFGEQLKAFLEEVVHEEVENQEPARYHTLDDIMHWLNDNGGYTFSESAEGSFCNYWYMINLGSDNQWIDLHYVERDFTFKRRGDDDWLDEPNHALNKRLLTSEPITSIGYKMKLPQ